MNNNILETLNITEEQIKSYNAKKDKIRNQTNARHKKYLLLNAEKIAQEKQAKKDLKQIEKDKKAILRAEELERQKRIYIKKDTGEIITVNLETRGRKRIHPIKEPLRDDNNEIIKGIRGRKRNDLNILDLVYFLK